MQSTPGERLLQFSHVLQTVLFDRLEVELGPLSEKARLLVAVVSALPLSRYVAAARGWVGRPSKDRQSLATAFLAKAVYGLETTRQMLERLRTDRQLRCLCGWNTVRQIPHESTFSRAFAEFARSELRQRLHAAPIECTQQAASSDTLRAMRRPLKRAKSFRQTNLAKGSGNAPSAVKPANAARD
jgi:hypothetical protein